MSFSIILLVKHLKFVKLIFLFFFLSKNLLKNARKNQFLFIFFFFKNLFKTTTIHILSKMSFKFQPKNVHFYKSIFLIKKQS